MRVLVAWGKRGRARRAHGHTRDQVHVRHSAPTAGARNKVNMRVVAAHNTHLTGYYAASQKIASLKSQAVSHRHKAALKSVGMTNNIVAITIDRHISKAHTNTPQPVKASLGVSRSYLGCIFVIVHRFGCKAVEPVVGIVYPGVTPCPRPDGQGRAQAQQHLKTTGTG